MYAIPQDKSVTKWSYWEQTKEKTLPEEFK